MQSRGRFRAALGRVGWQNRSEERERCSLSPEEPAEQLMWAPNVLFPCQSPLPECEPDLSGVFDFPPDRWGNDCEQNKAAACSRVITAPSFAFLHLCNSAFLWFLCFVSISVWNLVQTPGGSPMEKNLHHLLPLVGDLPWFLHQTLLSNVVINFLETDWTSLLSRELSLCSSSVMSLKGHSDFSRRLWLCPVINNFLTQISTRCFYIYFCSHSPLLYNTCLKTIFHLFVTFFPHCTPSHLLQSPPEMEFSQSMLSQYNPSACTSSPC